VPACFYVVLGITALMVVFTIWDYIGTRRLAASRPGENFDTFRSSFGTDEVPEVVLRAVYAKFQEWESRWVREFPVRAEDDIAGVYGIVDEDLDDLVKQLLAECGRQLPPETVFRHLGPVIINTVGDLARFVALCPQAAKPTHLVN
jgi:hypothetical protein